MRRTNSLLDEKNIFLWIGVLLAFMAVTFNQTLALIYGLMLTIILVFYAIRKEWGGRLLVNSNPNNTIPAIAMAIGSLFIFVFIVVILTTLFQSTFKVPPTVQTFFKHQFASTAPILAHSQLLTFLAWGIMIPILETRFFGLLYEFVAKQTSTNIYNLRTLRTWALIFLIAGLFTWFHIQAKGLVDIVAWMITFVFGVVTCVLISLTREFETATYLHIFNNSITILKNWGVI